MTKYKKIHIFILIVGALFLLSGIFHTNLWFDESYTVSLINHNLADICSIAADDVHPVLYYLMLKIFTYIFTDNVIIMRLFSLIGAFLLAFLGYTHIRKDFGEKTGLYFSAVTFLLSATFMYSGEIRMYTWAALFVTLTALYAYRIARNGTASAKNLILFTVFSLAGAYTHHYGLAATCVINAFLFITLIYSKIKYKRNGLWKYLVCAAGQVAAFIPGFIVLYNQVKSVNKGYWISISYPRVIFETLAYIFYGEYTDINIWEIVITITVCALFLLFIIKLILMFIKDKKSAAAPFFAFITVVSVVSVCLIISGLNTPIFYVRYLVVLYGLLIFFFAYLLANIKFEWLRAVILTVMFVLLVTSCIPVYIQRYDKSNGQMYDYLDKTVRPDDIMVSEEEVITNFIYKYPNKKYCIYQWDAEERNKAFMPNMETVRNVDFLSDYKGRIWMVSAYTNEYLLNRINLNWKPRTVTSLPRSMTKS